MYRKKALERWGERGGLERGRGEIRREKRWLEGGRGERRRQERWVEKGKEAREVARERERRKRERGGGNRRDGWREARDEKKEERGVYKWKRLRSTRALVANSLLISDGLFPVAI
ncbi:hypothetical protein Scep_014322 [Stephania cephalantha]|uniref:Uncharacterized protein n=1 Tax=Stephania cephalantha TaxID=152367 RepID=A0AAP0J3L1_9MAGN